MLHYSGYSCPKCDESDVQFGSLSALRQHLAKCHVTSLACHVYTTPEHLSVGVNFLPAIKESHWTATEPARSSLDVGRQRTTADTQLQSVLSQIWRQVNSANKTNAQAREQHKTELVRLRNDVEASKTDLISAKQRIEMLTAERNQLTSSYSQLAHHLNEQKQAAENQQLQLDEQNNAIMQKDE